MPPPLFRILGPLEVEGAPALGGPRPRALLRTLLLSANETVSPERLIDAVWGEHAPEGARHTLQVNLSALRKAIPGGHERIRTEPAGYRAVVDDDELDALHFQRLVGQGRAELARGDAAAAATTLRDALVLWRGPIEGGWRAGGEAARLEELRVTALEARIEADLELGRHAEAVPELERLVRADPLRERPRAQLMLALYRSGRQAEALAAYHDARRVLDEELGLEPGPELRRLEVSILRQDPELQPPERRARVRVPAPVTSMVGRREQLDAVCGLLVGDARLVTLTGPGGVGKTRIALHAAHELALRFADGVQFVDLAALAEPELVPAEIAAALEVPVGAGDTAGALADDLRERSLLLVLDNFEQVDDAAPLVGALLAAAPRLRCLVTSRRPLRIYGEREYEVPPLEREEAVSLFIDRARGNVRQWDEIAAVCDALDRLPLAVELAAARARRLPPGEMLRLLPDRLALATGGPRDRPDRQRTLEAAIAWSHDQLDDRLRAVFAALGVFAGGGESDAAEAVAGAGAAELEALASHSLLRWEGGRFQILATIRSFASARLAGGGRANEVRERHAAHYLALAERADRELREGGDQAAWLDRLERDHDNLRVALDHVAGEPRELRLTGALASFWAVRGHAEEGLDRLNRALARMTEADPPVQAKAPASELAPTALAKAPASELAPTVHAKALAGASVLEWERGRHDRSRALAERALALYRELRDGPGMVRALANLGFAAAATGDLAGARAHYEECLAVARAAGRDRDVVIALGCLTDLAIRARELDRARRLGEEVLAMALASPDQESAGVAQLNLGYVAIHDGRPADARGLLCDAAVSYGALGDTEGVSIALAGLAAVAPAPELAARLLGAADAHRVPGVAPDSFEPEVRERAARDARERLGADAFDAEFAAGRALTADEALALARAG